MHQQAREKQLTPNDAHELELFRQFLNRPGGNRQAIYEAVYANEVRKKT
jgi:hypothetical protein